MGDPFFAAPPRARTARRQGRAAVLLAVAAVPALVVGPAAAFWTTPGSGTGSSVTSTLARPTGVTVPATSDTDVTITWAAGSTGLQASGFYVLRNAAGGPVAACGSSQGAPITGNTCTDSPPDGTYTYTVVAVLTSWTAPSDPSGSVTVERSVDRKAS